MHDGQPRGAVYVAGTFDTKAEELFFIRDCILEQGGEVVTVDLSTSSQMDRGTDIRAGEVAAYSSSQVFCGERNHAIEAMASALIGFLRSRADISGLICAGGSGAAALVGPAMRALPIGLPKLLVTTMASGDIRPYVGTSDIAVLYPVVDVSGLNRISREVLRNASNAIAGMARHRVALPAGILPALGLSMFGVTTPCVQGVTRALQSEFECLVFHATGAGGRTLEKLAEDGHLAAMVDLTTTEIADLLCGGVLSAGEERLGAPIRNRGLPYVGSCGALDMVNFGARETISIELKERLFHAHNANVTLMRTTPEENARIGEWISRRLNQMSGPVRFLIPEGGISSLDSPGQPFWWPRANEALFDAICHHTHQTPQRQIVRIAAHINEPAFIEHAVQAVRSVVAQA